MIDDLAEAPLIPEHFVDRYVRANAYSVTKGKPRKVLTQAQYDVMLALSQGKSFEEMKAEGISNDPSQIAFLAKARLGCTNNAQAVAVAVSHGILPVPEPVFPPGRPLQASIAAHKHTELTKREKQILQRLANGKTAPEIAADFGTSMDTVHTQIKILRSKYSARNSAHLAALAVRMGHIG